MYLSYLGSIIFKHYTNYGKDFYVQTCINPAFTYYLLGLTLYIMLALTRLCDLVLVSALQTILKNKLRSIVLFMQADWKYKKNDSPILSLFSSLFVRLIQ